MVRRFLTENCGFKGHVHHDQTQDLARVIVTKLQNNAHVQILRTLANNSMALTDVSTSRGCMVTPAARIFLWDEL